jgi:hypothetical protein
MTGIVIELDETKEEIIGYDVSDEALEAAAGTDQKIAGNYTLGACTGLSVCPGW